ncbi:MAG: hypothetical protein AAFQ19_17455 [Pseudomonadota bacterium]
MLEVLVQDTGALRALGVSAAVLSVCAFLPYIRDTLVGRTHPHRASWLIWSVLGCIALGSQVAQGAHASLWFAAMQVGCTVFIFALTIRRGNGAWLAPGDTYVLAAAGLGLLMWSVTHTAAYALGMAITVSLLGGICTVRKAYRAPGSETLSTWVLSTVAAALALLSVGTLDWVLLAYPAYLLVLYAAIVTAILLGRVRAADFAGQPKLGPT